jgi:hypothetical protein
MTGSKFNGELVMESLQVGNHLFIGYGAEFMTDKEINLAFADIGGGINLSGGISIPTVNLTGAKIKGELGLASAENLNPTWRENSKLTLINAKAGALQAYGNSWPDEVDMTGFTYGRLGGFTAEGEGRLDIGKADWFEKILARQKHFSPQPYQQLGALLQKEGYEERAREILWAGKERQKKETLRPIKSLFEGNFFKSFRDLIGRLFMNLEKYFIGYGYYNFFSLIWVAIFTGIGVCVLWWSGEGATHGMRYGIPYSFDMILPIIQLNPEHYKISFDTLSVRWYFYFQQLMGYVLASFLIAGLSGFTRR